MTALPSNVRFPQERLIGRDCPACGGDTLRSFYAVDGIPVQSDLLCATADEAANFPTGNVLLAVCETCAFVTNAAFDESKLAMAYACKSTQVCMPTLGAIATSLADRWIERYSLRGRTIVEIGCGQGEFLELICGKAGARGIGFDPAVRRERGDAADVLFVPGRFEDFAAEVRADFICCRHTLDHIADPLRFLTTVREPLDETPVAFEVADAARVLADGAFWDICYERNSYFTRGSLTRAFQRAGFEVGDTSLELAGEHLVLEAEPTGGQKRYMPTLSELRQASQFVRVCTTRMQTWLDFADDARQRGRRCVIWGTGSKTVGFLTSLGIADAFTTVIDNNPAKHGSYLPGTRLAIKSSTVLRDVRPDAVVVISPKDQDEIASDLAAMGLTPEILALKK